MCFVWISEQTAIISLYSINWLVFITETECVYCAVRTESLYTIHVSDGSNIATSKSVRATQWNTLWNCIETSIEYKQNVWRQPFVFCTLTFRVPTPHM
jgi:hypothetical protein